MGYSVRRPTPSVCKVPHTDTLLSLSVCNVVIPVALYVGRNNYQNQQEKVTSAKAKPSLVLPSS